jgi:DNA polymerase-4
MGGMKNEADWHDHKVIMHIDMDAFFAAVEQKINPSLRGRPVIVGGPSDSRGVVSTCSYEARNYGVHSAMPMKQASRLCPDAVYLDTSGGKYTYISVRILNILKRYSPNVEPVSIDEAFVDITGSHAGFGGPEKLAVSVKKDIKREQGLTASIGIGPNRFVAKMASSSSKPDGLVIIPPEEVRQYLWIQPVNHLWGIGPRTGEALQKIGICTIGDLAGASEVKLKKMFGIMGPVLKRMANGEGDDIVRLSIEEHEAKSIGHEHTFHRDTNDEGEVTGLLMYLSDRVSRRLRLSGCESRTVTLKIRKSDFKLVTRAITLNVYFSSEKIIYRAAKELLVKNKFLDHPVRLIGVSVSNLRKSKVSSPGGSLFDNDFHDRNLKIDELLDNLRDHHGEESILYASSLIFQADYS